MNEKGRAPGWSSTWLPLSTAVERKHHDVVVWLLSHGADPNNDKVMYNSAYNSTAAVLQLLIDAGGDVNRESWGEPPLFPAVRGDNSEVSVRVLVSQPSLDLTITYGGRTPVEYARGRCSPFMADMIAQEVSGKGLPVLLLLARCVVGADGVWRCCGWQISRRETLVRPLFCSFHRACAMVRA